MTAQVKNTLIIRKNLSKSLKKSYITQKSNMFGMKTKALELQKLEIRLLKKVMEIT